MWKISFITRITNHDNDDTNDDNIKTTSISFFIADFNLLSYEFGSFTFKLLY